MSAQVNITTYGGIGVPTRHTTITPTIGGYEATTYGGIGVPTTHSTITIGNGFGSQGFGSQGIQSAPQQSVIIPRNLVYRLHER
jgi:hypothetical protein